MVKGTIGVLNFMTARIHSGALPPGVGRTSRASPSQTKDMPSVTTMDGRLRRWIRAPSAA